MGCCCFLEIAGLFFSSGMLVTLPLPPSHHNCEESPGGEGKIETASVGN